MEIQEMFVQEENIEFELFGHQFVYKPVTAGEENSWIDEYLILKDGKYVQDNSLVNKCKMRNLVKAPFDNWENLDHNKRWEILSKLKPSIFSAIVKKINGVDSPAKKD
jgi:hypothetical protein